MDRLQPFFYAVKFVASGAIVDPELALMSVVDPFNADFRGAKSTHIPHGKPQCFQGKRRLFVRGFSAC
jgi:hypothetical protein